MPNRLGPDDEESFGEALAAHDKNASAAAIAFASAARGTPPSDPAWPRRAARALETGADDLLAAAEACASKSPELAMVLARRAPAGSGDAVLSQALREAGRSPPGLRLRLQIEYAATLLAGPSRDLGMAALDRVTAAIVSVPIAERVELCEKLAPILARAGRAADALRLVESLLQEAGPAQRLVALTLRGVARSMSGKGVLARADFEQALTLAREDGDPLAEAKLCANLGQTLMAAGERAAALAHLSDALALADEIGWDEGVARISLLLGKEP